MKHVFNGPLRKCPDNPRYFADASGKAIYLSGSHTWSTFQDHINLDGSYDKTMLFDYEDWLRFSEKNEFNFLRLWCRESAFGGFGGGQATLTNPVAYAEANPDRAPTQTPKYDLTKFNPLYFERLRDRVIKAGERGIYVAIMLFEAWSVDTRSGSPWFGHPYNVNNNINGIDGNPVGAAKKIALSQENDTNPFAPDEHILVHTLENPEITKLQKAYVKKVIEVVNDLDNVMFEIVNEALRWSKYWQYEIIDYIKEVEVSMPKQHPVWMSHLVTAQNEALYVSHADAISPGVESTDESYCINPPAADGRKVILADTDHLGGIWGTSQWVWKSFMRGINPIFMDAYGMRIHGASMIDGAATNDNPVSVLFGRSQFELPETWREPVREAMAQTLRFAKKMNMTKMLPYNEVSSTGYCLADPNEEYLIYQPEAGLFKLRLIGAKGPFSIEWFNPNTGETIPGRSFTGGMPIDFTPPYLGEIVLHLKRINE